MKVESRSLLLGRKRKYVMAEPFTDHEDPDFVVEHERLGTIEAFREGLRELRALEGRSVVRRRRTWVAACEIGSVELVQGYGKSGKFFLEQRGRYWLGKAWSCSEWVVDRCTADFDESGEIKDESDAALRRIGNRQAVGYEEGLRMKDERIRIREVVREAALSSEGCEKRTGWFVVIVGTEVAEKRGRHWVRLPYCCRVRVEAVMEQNSLNSLNLQNCSHLSPFGGVPRFDRNGHDVLHNGGLRSMQSQKTLLELEGVRSTDEEAKNVAAVDRRLESEMPVSAQTEKVDLVCGCTCLDYKFREIGDWGHFEPGGLILDLRARPPSLEDWPRFRVCDCHAIRAG